MVTNFGQLTKTESTAVILVKAAPLIGQKHGETVCCAGIDPYGNWVRMYPISFRAMDHAKRFKRWDRVSFTSTAPKNDTRTESRRVETQTLEIVGKLSPDHRANFLSKLIVKSLGEERKSGRSFALIKPRILNFTIEKKGTAELNEEQEKLDTYHNQHDLFMAKPTIPKKACPHKFKYNYKIPEGTREGTCQDWETEATFFKWRALYGEQKAIELMQHQFGDEIPKKNLHFAMGTHSHWPDTWLINGLIQIPHTDQESLI